MSKSQVRDWRVIIFLLILSFPLCFQFLFHPGTSADYRLVVVSLLLATIISGILIDAAPAYPDSIKIRSILVFWVLWGGVAILNSAEPLVSCIRQIEWTVLVLFTGVLTAVSYMSLQMFVAIYTMLLVGFMIAGLQIALFWSWLPDPENYSWVWDTPNFTNIRNFGHYAAASTVLSSVGLVLITYHLKELKIKIVVSGLVIFNIVSFGFLFWSGGRGSVIAVFLGLGWLLFWGPEKRKRKVSMVLTALSAFLGYFLSSLFPVQHKFLGFLNALERTLNVSSLDRLLSGRVMLWEDAITTMLTREGSLIYGFGPDTYRLIAFKPSVIQPHNIMIQSLLDWGVIGLIIFSSLLVYFFILSWKQARIISNTISSNYTYSIILGAQAVWVTYCFLGLVDGVFYHALPLTILSACAAMVFAFEYRYGNPE